MSSRATCRPRVSALAAALSAIALALLPAMAVAQSATVVSPEASQSPDRMREKAAFLLELARFVNWPSSVLGASDAPFVIGVLDDEPLRDALARELAEERVGGRRIRVAGYPNLHEYDPCPLLYVGTAKARLMPVVVEFLDGAPVLTVGEREGFLEHGGMVRLLERPERIAFEIDLNATAKVGLEVSSQLLRVADRVVGAPGELPTP